MNWEVGIAFRVAGINVQELAVRCRAEGHQVPSTELCFGVGSCILKWLVGRLRYHIYHRRCKISLIGSLVFTFSSYTRLNQTERTYSLKGMQQPASQIKLVFGV